jgi:flagellin
MGLRINTNVPSISAQTSVRKVSRERAESFSKLASGHRITKSADDAAGLAISDKLNAHIISSRQANRNAQDGISFVQVAEGGLNEVTNILTRLRELSVQAASDTIGDDERKFTNMEYQELKLELDRIANVTDYNGTNLLNGTGSTLEFQIGVKNDPFQDRINYETSNINATLDNLNISGITVEDKGGAQDSLETLDAAIQNVAGQRAELGALQNRLTKASNNLENSIENLSAANSRIKDLDYAEATSNSSRLNILENAGTAVLAQANTSQQAALRLVG